MGVNTFSINHREVPTDKHYTLRALIGLKDALVDAGGEVKGSSRGSGKVFDGTDNWTIAALEGGLFNATGSKGAWCVILLADGVRQLILQSYNATTGGHWSVGISVDGSWSFSGTSTATQVEAPTNQRPLFGAVAPYALAILFDTDADARGLRWNAYAKTDGSFWFFAWADGVSFPQTMIVVDVLSEYAVGDADPCVYCADYEENGFSFTTGIFKEALANFSYVAAPYAGDWDTTPGMYYMIGAVLVAPGSGTGSSIVGTGRENPHTNTWDLLPLYYGRAIADGTEGSWKGKSSLFDLSPGNHGLANLTVTLDRDRAVFPPLAAKDWDQGKVLER